MEAPRVVAALECSESLTAAGLGCGGGICQDLPPMSVSQTLTYNQPWHWSLQGAGPEVLCHTPGRGGSPTSE